MSGPADFKSVTGFENWLRFVWVIEQNKICNSFCQLSLPFHGLQPGGSGNSHNYTSTRIEE